MNYTYFLVSVTDKVATVSINRPDKSNAFTLEMWKELEQVFDYVSELPEARVVILKGEGKNFCAGMDLKVFMGIPSLIEATNEEEKRQNLKAFIAGLQANITSIEKCKVPVIAAIHGACIGGGINIATACDMIYTCDGSYISIKEVDLGIVADIGVLQRLPRTMSPMKVRELSYTGRNISGAEAKELGMVNDNYSTAEELHEKVAALAKVIASKSPKVIRGIKQVMDEQQNMTTTEALDHMAEYNSRNLFTEDLAEAMGAYFEKRAPQFED